MALAQPNTLAAFKTLSLSTHMDWSETPCSAVASRMQEFMKNDINQDQVPERAALYFYGLNHALAILAQNYDEDEPLPMAAQQLARSYYLYNSRMAVRSAYYLLWICIREARHNQSLGISSPKMKELFGPETPNFLLSISGGEPQISKAFLENPPETTIGKFVSCLRWQFFNSKWGHSFGGPKWGAINECLEHLVYGKYSPEMMLDTVWTLSHNGGPIFNKGRFFGMYDHHEIVRVLDVQRSGQIPEYVLKGAAHADEPLKEKMQLLKSLFPDAIGDYVDWFKVKALGAVGHYPNEQAGQIAAYGPSEWADKEEKMKAEAAAAKIKKELKEKEEFDKTHLVIMPGVYVKKVEVRKAA